MNINGSTERDIQINSMKSSVLNDFANSPSYFVVLKNGVEQGFNVLEESIITKNPNKKRLICKPDETIIVGDIINFNSSKWICTDNDITSEIYDIGIITRCNNTLKFYPSSTNSNENSLLIEVPCIVGKGSLNLDENKFMSIPADENVVRCANTVDSLKIALNTRFILNGDAYSVIGVDKIEYPGLLTIRIKEDQINTADDRIDLGIANWVSHQVTKEIYILNGTEASLLYTNATLQLDVLCKDNSVVVSNPTVTYATSSAYVATVSTTGLITANGTGDAIISATYGSSTATITIHSEMVVSDNYNIVLSPTDTTLKLSRSLVLTAHAMKNGIEDLTREFTWELSNLDGSSGNYASINYDFATDNICTITASNLSSVANKYVIIKCTLTSDNSVFTERQIKIINLF